MLTWSIKICSPYFSAISCGKLYLNHDETHEQKRISEEYGMETGRLVYLLA